MIVGAPSAIADPGKNAAIADFLCRIKKSQAWRESIWKPGQKVMLQPSVYMKALS
ncbi:hypothetical protein [Nostoc sp.]|uniref:hypothetical protein n=1 Tax=Nostoc sp. TaxID=1180 RepID=UPI002FF9CE0B